MAEAAVDTTTVLAGLTLALVTLLAWKTLSGGPRRGSSGKKLSDGPRRGSGKKSFDEIPTVPGLPFFGSAARINLWRPDLTLLRWAKQYGPVYKVKLFNMTFVAVSRYEEMYEMLVSKGKVFAGRNEQFKLMAVMCGTKDVINGSPAQAHWLPLRKAAHRGIRHYGDGLTHLEETLATMARSFVDRVKAYEGKPVDLKDDIYSFVLMVTVTMICGKQVTDDKDVMVTTMKRLERLLAQTINSEGFELDFFPWLRHLGHPTYRKIQEFCRQRDRLWDDMSKYSQQNYTSQGDATCIMHSIFQLTDKNSRYYDPHVDDDCARGLFSDLVFASILTTSYFSYGIPNLLLHYPDVYKRIRDEVDHVIGADRQPSIFDRDAMPYCVATIFEVLRYSALVLAVVHKAQEDTALGDYDIPAGTAVWPLFPAVLRDKEFWGDPDVFRPDRFLDSDGSLLPADHPNRKHMVQFGFGPRMCIGEAFAQKRMFIFLTSLVQAFDLQPGTDTLVPCDYNSLKLSTLLCQQPYTVRLLARQK